MAQNLSLESWLQSLRAGVDNEERGSDKPSASVEENAGRFRLPRQSNADR